LLRTNNTLEPAAYYIEIIQKLTQELEAYKLQPKCDCQHDPEQSALVLFNDYPFRTISMKLYSDVSKRGDECFNPVNRHF
jgi:hypothetical protein